MAYEQNKMIAPRWGRTVLYWMSHWLITTRASSTLANSSPLRTSSRMVPLKRLDKRVLLPASFLDERRLHALLGQPLAEAGRDELAAVVGAEHLRLAVLLEQLLELADHVTGAD